MTTLPTLYKQSTTGAIQQWTVSVRECVAKEFTNPVKSAEVTTVYGQVGGQMQSTTDTVSEGKNLGKANATDAWQQAHLQAKQQWDKKKKQGYTESLEQAQTTTNVLAAIKPMLAHVYEDHPKKVTWPAYVQPKLDGMRCIAIVKDGKCTLWSRTQKPIDTMPHVITEVEQLADSSGDANFILDGELYSHKYSDNFNEIMSMIKRSTIHPNHRQVQYHVYDLASSSLNFEGRLVQLRGILDWAGDNSPVKWVKTTKVSNEEEMLTHQADMIYRGYEGLMYRNADSFYEGKRSHGLLKVKTFRDEEFITCGVEEGNGKLQGKAGAIWCLTKDGKRFKAKMQGALESLTDYLENFNTKYIGRPLTVKFQNYTPDGVPRFPVGIRFREVE